MNIKFKQSIPLFVFGMLFFVSTDAVHAQGFSTNLIVCDGVNVPCTFNSLVQLGRNFVNLLIVYSVPIAVISFTYAGFLLLTSQGNAGAVSKARGIFLDTAIGFMIVLAAWLIVSAITGSLLDPIYNPLR